MSYVLIVDDDAMMAQTLADMVELFGWKATIAHGPRPAMQALQGKPPALILLDLNMPGVDGMEVCRFIKRDPIAAKTMVVFVTAEDDPTIQQKAREAGAADYLVKPVDIDRLEGILDKLSRDKAATLSKPAETAETDKAGEASKPPETGEADKAGEASKPAEADRAGQADKVDQPVEPGKT